MVKMARGFLLAMVAVLGAAGLSAAAAEAKPTLTPEQSAEVAGARLEIRAERAGATSFAIDRCVRRSRSVFSCRGTLVRLRGSDTVDCALRYRVSRRGTGLTTTMTRKRCVTRAKEIDGFPLPTPRDPDNRFQQGPGPKYCPGYKGAESWDAKPDIVGKTYAEAVPIAAEHGCIVRISRIDGEGVPVTMDLRFERLNVEVEGPDQLITAISSVG